MPFVSALFEDVNFHLSSSFSFHSAFTYTEFPKNASVFLSYKATLTFQATTYFQSNYSFGGNGTPVATDIVNSTLKSGIIGFIGGYDSTSTGFIVLGAGGLGIKSS